MSFCSQGDGVGLPTCITGHMTTWSASGEICNRGGGGGGLQPGGVCIIGVEGTTPPEIHGTLWDTVNKRVVGILLEFSLVLKKEIPSDGQKAFALRLSAHRISSSDIIPQQIL